MNYSGSYRHLLKNSESALLASIEIYNKPQFRYRDECVVILLLNAWELLLKAIVSKNQKSIFYRKKRNESYRTLSLNDAFNRAEKYFPRDILTLPVRRNLDLLTTYRDNSVHFYNERGFGSVIYSLAQTSIKNFRDLSEKMFGKDFSAEITWALLPLGFRTPVDPIDYISGKNGYTKKANSAIGQFMAELKKILDELEKSRIESDRLLTIFNVKLESVKKISKADVTIGVGVGGKAAASGPLAIVRNIDPNVSHPLRRKMILEKIKTLQGIKFTSYSFDAVIWRYKIKENKNLCWQADEKVLTKYSNDIHQFLKNLKKKDIQDAITAYKGRLISKSV